MNKWTRDETIVAFNLYCKIPFKSSSKSNPIIKKYALLLNRTPSSLNMKIGNIGRLDPDLRAKGITGLTHGSKLDEEIWNEFSKDPDSLAFESEKVIAKLQGKTIEENSGIDMSNLPQGKERELIVKQRVNQSFFRMSVLSSYNNRCCISGICNAELLEACHILEWSRDIANRTNPKNGLCMNPFFHRAYDKLFLSISPDLNVVVSDRLLNCVGDSGFRYYLNSINGKKIITPDKFFPNKDFLELHYVRFKKAQYIDVE